MTMNYATKMSRTFITTDGGTEIALAPDYNGGCYVIQCRGGYTCLGYAVCAERTVRYLRWLASQNAGRPVRHLPAPGTVEAYQLYEDVLTAMRAKAESLGIRCNADLSSQLIMFEGRRVEVVDQSGKTRRFRVQRSGGWLPCHLEIKTTRSTGGTPADREYQSVRLIR
jgi:hypothetical protein